MNKKFNIISGPLSKRFVYKEWLYQYAPFKIIKCEGLDGKYGYKHMVFPISGINSQTNLVKMAINYGSDIKEKDEIITQRDYDWTIARVKWGPKCPTPLQVQNNEI